MIIDEDVLSHYGVRGMKWGKRKEQRYTNSDGTSMSDKQRNAVDKKRAAKINKIVSYGYLSVMGAGLVASMIASDKAHMKVSTAGASAKANSGKGFVSNLPKKTLKQVETERNTRYQNAKSIQKIINESKRLNP